MNNTGIAVVSILLEGRKMNRYQNLNGNSSIYGYSIESDRISVTFNDGRTYSYSYGRAGKNHVDTMKVLAERGSGLNSYIMRNVRYLYD